ncbi:unnamed protein product [Euphydryas editha]|uniref:Reverse transcriptase domain-containing protein n=1 Tax=Euphydryas editha TaxID=104508 RepID=A0AAU9VD44_EUPED|nr:unnamed protein product [Euphydryas editha]
MVTAKCTKEESDKDQKAQELIVTRVEENILTLLTSCTTAYDMWEKLNIVYEAKSKVGIHLLQQKFYNLKYEGPMAKFMAQVEELLHQLNFNHWFRDYLTDRTFRVKVGDVLSEETEVRCGVPQGSATGPLCYLLHVNSLFGVLHNCSAYMYADDLCTLHAGTDIEEMCRSVQRDIDAVVRWSHDNGIILNSEKTKFMVIKSPYVNY